MWNIQRDSKQRPWKESIKIEGCIIILLKPQSKNPNSLHDSNSFEQPINERDVNTSKNASNNHITNDKTCSSSEPSEINEIQPEIDNDNVEGFSLGGNTNHSQSQKGRKANGTQGENSNRNGPQDFLLLNQ